MIRTHTPQDLDKLMTIWLNGNFDGHGFIPADYWRQNAPMVRMMMREAQVYLWEEKGEPVGFIGLFDGHISGIFVNANMRGRGIGKALLDYAKQRHGHLELEVYDKNTAAHRLYLREGFRETGVFVEQATGESSKRMEWNR